VNVDLYGITNVLHALVAVTLWQCAAKVILAFLIFAALVL